jgi:hypothetical protein
VEDRVVGDPSKGSAFTVLLPKLIEVQMEGR